MKSPLLRVDNAKLSAEPPIVHESFMPAELSMARGHGARKSFLPIRLVRPFYLFRPLAEQVRANAIRLRRRRVGKPPDNLRLSMRRQGSVARKRRQAVVMSKILRPRLELFSRKFEFIGQLDERISKAVRVEIGQARPCKGLLEDRADGVGVRPRRALQTVRAKLRVRAVADVRLGEDWVFRAEAYFAPQERHPIDHDFLNVGAHGEKPCREGLRALGAGVARVLFEQFMLEVYILEPE